MTEWFFALAGLGAIIAFWLSTMSSRDVARSLVARFCSDNDLQLLDQTVALRRLAIRRNEKGNLSFLRVFRFDYSDNGFRRRDGMVWMLGSRPIQISLQVADRQIVEDLQSAQQEQV